MTQTIKKFTVATILWLAGTAMAFAECDANIDTGKDPFEDATLCFLGGRGAVIVATQPDLTARRTTQNNAVLTTQAAAAVDLDGFSGPLWVSLAGRWSELNDADLDLGIATIGGDVWTDQNNIFGVMLENDFALQDGPGGTSFDATGFMAGVYMIHQGKSLSFDGRLLAGRSKTDVTGGGNQADDVASTRWLAAVQVSQFHPLANGRALIPHAALSWFEDDMDAYMLGLTPVGAEKISYGQANLGGTLRVPISVGANDGSILIGASAIGGFGDSAGSKVPDSLRGRVDLGIELFRANAWSVSGRVTSDGLGHDDYSALGADVGVTLWF